MTNSINYQNPQKPASPDDERMVFKAVIIDDQEMSRVYLYNLIKEHCKEVEVVAMADSVENGVDIINAQTPQIVFLDVELVKGSGFEVLEQVNRENFEVVFTTGHEKYALQAIKNSALDYLQKPVAVEELKNAIKKVEKRSRERSLCHSSEKDSDEKKITLNTNTGVEFIPVSDIIRCESDHYYSFVYLTNGKRMLISKTLKEFEKLLAPHNFVRIHQSHLVNLKFLKSYLKSESIILLSDNAKLPVSRRKRELLVSKLPDL